MTHEEGGSSFGGGGNCACFLNTYEFGVTFGSSMG